VAGGCIGAVGVNLQRSLVVFAGMKPEVRIVLIALAFTALIFAVLIGAFLPHVFPKLQLVPGG
jgi:Mg/Co/Ni transporter MgtE